MAKLTLAQLEAALSGEHDVLMLWECERSGLVGRGVGVVSSTVARVRPRMAVDGRFLLHALRRNVAWIQSRRAGTGVRHVAKDLADRLIIDHPGDPSEERRIAEILDTIDEAIRRTEQVIAKLQQMKRALLHALLTRGIDNFLDTYRCSAQLQRWRNEASTDRLASPPRTVGHCGSPRC